MRPGLVQPSIPKILNMSKTKLKNTVTVTVHVFKHER